MDKNIQKVLKYKTVICKRLVATELLPYLMTVDTIKPNDVCLTIYETAAVNPVKAAEILIEQLVHSKEPGWYTTFHKALKEKEYEVIIQILEKGPEVLKDQKVFDDLLGVYYPELCDKIDPVQLLPWLMKTECIIKEDMEKVYNTSKIRSSSEAMILLLLKISKRSPNWFAGFMIALKESGHVDLVESIEPKLVTAAEEGYEETVQLLGKMCRQYEEQQQNEQRKVRRPTEGAEASDSGYTEASCRSRKTKQHNIRQCQRNELSSDRSAVIQIEAASSTLDMDSAANLQRAPTPVVPIPDFTLESLNLNVENKPPTLVYVKNDGSSITSGPLTPGSSLSGLSEELKSSKISGKGDVGEMKLAYQSDPAVELEALNMMHPSESLSQEPDMILLRNYQNELIQPAWQGKNSIIYAPKGAGKTFTAMALAKHKLETNEKIKVIHLVPDECLDKTVELYTAYVQDHTCVAIRTEKPSGVFQNECHKNDVLITTAQIFVQALNETEGEILGIFSLMILGVCREDTHQTVLSCYLQEKKNKHPVPQVLGLLDTFVWGKASNEDDARKDILKLCAQFDCDCCICKVEKHRSELRKHVVLQDQELYNLEGRKQDPFCTLATGLMMEIKSMIERHKVTGSPQAAIEKVKAKMKCIPNGKGCSEYKKWLKSLVKPVAMIQEEAVRREYEAYFFNLKIYNDALMINEDCHTSNAVDFIKKKIADHCRYEKDKELQRLFRGTMVVSSIDKLQQQDDYRTHQCKSQSWGKDVHLTEKERLVALHGNEKMFANPKLNKLCEILQDYYDRQKNQLQAVVYCKSMNIAECLTKWLGNSGRFDELLVKSQGFSSDGKDENQIQRYFRKGKAAVLLTEAKCEGFIKGLEHCNCVIHYMLDEDESNQRKPGTLKVRGKGGNRDSNPENYIEGLHWVSHLSEADFGHHIKVYQLEMVDQHRGINIKDIIAKGATARETSNRVLFYCAGDGCKILACNSSEIQKKDGMGVVISESFREKVDIVDQQSKASSGVQIVGKLLCKECNSSWGVLVKGDVYVVTVSSFNLKYPDGTTRRFKKWANVEGVVINEQTM